MAKFSSVSHGRRWGVLVVILSLIVQNVLGGEREGEPVAAAHLRNSVLEENLPTGLASGDPGRDNQSGAIEAGDSPTAEDDTDEHLEREGELASEEQFDNDVTQQGVLADPSQHEPVDPAEMPEYGFGGRLPEVAEAEVINEEEEADEGNMRAGQVLTDTSIASDATFVTSEEPQPGQSGGSRERGQGSAAQQVDQGSGEEGEAELRGSPQERTDETAEEEAKEVSGAAAEEDDRTLPESPQEGNDEATEVEATDLPEAGTEGGDSTLPGSLQKRTGEGEEEEGTEVSGASQGGDSTSPGSPNATTSEAGEDEAEESQAIADEDTPSPSEKDLWEEDDNSVDVVDDVEEQPPFPVRPSKRGLFSSFGSKAVLGALTLAVTAGLAYAGAKAVGRSRRRAPHVQQGPEWIEMHEFLPRARE